jgi:hypothetical protein
MMLKNFKGSGIGRQGIGDENVFGNGDCGVQEKRREE